LKHLATERRNPRSGGLDQKSSLEIARIMNREDRWVALAVQHELPKIARAIDAIVKAFRHGGRLFYIGAGTSGRIAVLDASECPPTFGTPPQMVQAVIAGGARAIRHSVEGAEDSVQDGARDLARAGFTHRDVAIGIAASGTTPYVLGALRLARKLGAVTIGVTCNRHSPLAREPRIAIATETGPEAISGSTRLKAGTAQKMVLNMLSTGAMVRLGKVYDHWMIHVALSNAKLRRRGVRILEEAGEVASSTAEHALRQADHDLPAALVMLKTGATLREAQRLLKIARGNVREAIHAAKLAREKSRIKKR
jgi:N-acetylmuramic acid 6-phosphate etherase